MDFKDEVKQMLVNDVNNARLNILPAMLQKIDDAVTEPFLHSRFTLNDDMIKVRRACYMEILKGPISFNSTPYKHVVEIHKILEILTKDVCHLLNGLSLDKIHPTDAVFFAIFYFCIKMYVFLFLIISHKLHRSRHPDRFVFNEIDKVRCFLKC